MFFALLSALSLDPKKIDEFFVAIRRLLWGTFETIVLALAMAAVIVIAWRHIPRERKPPANQTRSGGEATPPSS